MYRTNSNEQDYNYSIPTGPPNSQNYPYQMESYGSYQATTYPQEGLIHGSDGLARYHMMREMEARGAQMEIRGNRDLHSTAPPYDRAPSNQSPAQPLSIEKDPILAQVMERGRRQREYDRRLNENSNNESYSTTPEATGAPSDHLAPSPPRNPLPPPPHRNHMAHGQHVPVSSIPRRPDAREGEKRLVGQANQDWELLWEQRGPPSASKQPARTRDDVFGIYGQAGSGDAHSGRADVRRGFGQPRRGTIGLGLSQKDGATVVSSLLPGLPASNNGRIMVGDMLICVDNRPIPADLGQTVAMLQGEAGRAVTLILERRGAGMYEIALTRMVVPEGQRRMEERRSIQSMKRSTDCGGRICSIPL